ncbi:MAG: hypothetical protein GQ582_05505 [Methyloprofundus sp.]|nr:hypothetical protein [Methyloprofundus sp.]
MTELNPDTMHRLVAPQAGRFAKLKITGVRRADFVKDRLDRFGTSPNSGVGFFIIFLPDLLFI